MPGREVSVSVREFRRNLSNLLREVREGAELVITSRGRAVARVVPARPRRARPIGLLRGRIGMAPDFDEMPADLIAAMEGGNDPA